MSQGENKAISKEHKDKRSKRRLEGLSGRGPTMPVLSYILGNIREKNGV